MWFANQVLGENNVDKKNEPQTLIIDIDSALLDALEQYRAVRGFESLNVTALEVLRDGMFGTARRMPARTVDGE
jgi:hypothetical protein